MESEGESQYTAGSTPASDVPIDCDSFLSSDDSDRLAEVSSTVSVMSSVRRFERENGRTYHSYRAGRYHFPNDPNESERLDFQYAVHQQALNETLHFAPLSNPRTVLDIGTGTGAWAIQMGDAYPDALVEGTDLSPIQPSNVPENVQFLVDDAEQDDWAIPENHYDFIHTRILMGCFRDFRRVIQQGFKHTKPGGWMESHDVMHPPFCDDGSMPDDWPFKEWSEYIEGASEQVGRPLGIAHKLRRWYILAGFVDVREKVIKLPINTWPRDKKLKVLGKWWAENLLMGLQAFSLALFSRVLGWNKTEIEVYLVNVRKAIMNNRVHAYHRFYVVWGRKPENPPVSTNTTTPVDSTVPANLTPVPAFTKDNTSSAQTSIPAVLTSSQLVHPPEPRIKEFGQPNPTIERKEESHNYAPEPPIQELTQPDWTIERKEESHNYAPEPPIQELTQPDWTLERKEESHNYAPEPPIQELTQPDWTLERKEGQSYSSELPTQGLSQPGWTLERKEEGQSYSSELPIQESSQPNWTFGRKEEGHNYFSELPIQESSQANWTLECRDKLPIRPPEPQINEPSHPGMMVGSTVEIFDHPPSEPQINKSTHPDLVFENREEIYDPLAPEPPTGEFAQPNLIPESNEKLHDSLT